MFEALVPLLSTRDSILRTLSTGERIRLRLWETVHSSETGLALTNIGRVSTELPTEARWTQAAHHLRSGHTSIKLERFKNKKCCKITFPRTRH